MWSLSRTIRSAFLIASEMTTPSSPKPHFNCRIGEIRTLSVTMTLASRARPLPDYGHTTLYF